MTGQAGARFGPIALAPGVAPRHVATKLAASFITIGALSGMAILQSYILSEHLHVPRAIQGRVSGDLAFWTEVVGLALFLPFGMLADRIGRRPVFVFGMLCLAAGWALYPFATSLDQLLAFRLVYAVGAAATAGMLATLVNDYPLDRSRGKLIGFTAVMNTLGTMFVAGAIGRLPAWLSQHGYSGVDSGTLMYLVVAGLCLAMAIIAARGLMAGRPPGAGQRPDASELAATAARALRNPRIALAYAGAFIARSDVVIKGMFLGLWAVHAGRDSGIGAGRAMAAFATMVLIMYFVSLISAPLFGWFIDRVNRVTAMIVALAIASAGYLGMRWLSSPIDMQMTPLLILLTLGTGFVVKASMALIGQEAPPRERATVISGSSICGAAGILLFTAIGGRLFDAWGPWAPFVIAGGYQALLLLVAIAVRLRAPGPH